MEDYEKMALKKWIQQWKYTVWVVGSTNGMSKIFKCIWQYSIWSEQVQANVNRLPTLGQR